MLKGYVWLRSKANILTPDILFTKILIGLSIRSLTQFYAFLMQGKEGKTGKKNIFALFSVFLFSVGRNCFEMYTHMP